MTKRAASRIMFPKKKIKRAKTNTRVDRAVRYTVYNGISGPLMIATLRYVTTAVQTEAITGWTEYVMRANSIFDPDVTAAGHQPLGHDQIANLYQLYKVRASTITVWAVQNQSSQPVAVYLAPAEGSAGIGVTCAEYPGAQNVLVSQDTAGPNSMKLKSTVDIRKYSGNKGQPFDDNYGASMGANPQDEVFWHIVAQNAIGGASVDVTYLIQVDYVLEAYNRVDLGQS